MQEAEGAIGCRIWLGLLMEGFRLVQFWKAPCDGLHGIYTDAWSEVPMDMQRQ